MSLRKIKFLNFIFDKNNINFTVRLGENYYNELKIGEKIILINVKDENEQKEARLVEFIKCNFSCIPKYVYDLEHDPTCKHKNGLIEAMKKAYGERFIAKEDAIVSCIGFRII